MSAKHTISVLTFCALLNAFWEWPLRADGQLVQPVISEYKTKASGRLVLTNNSSEPMAVVLEPRSFSISAEGHGTFRTLDPGIDVQLSAASVKLQPLESYYIFYTATAQSYPAWFTIYATFSQVHHSRTLDVRIQLPHTVYIYQRKPLEKSEIEISKAVYLEDRHQISVELKNIGSSLGRVQTVRASGPKGDSALASGFPMLPGLTRHVQLDWKESYPPTMLRVEFEHFSLTPAITIEPRAVAAAQSLVATPQAAVTPLPAPEMKAVATPQR